MRNTLVNIVGAASFAVGVGVASPALAAQCDVKETTLLERLQSEGKLSDWSKEVMQKEKTPCPKSGKTADGRDLHFQECDNHDGKVYFAADSKRFVYGDGKGNYLTNGDYLLTKAGSDASSLVEAVADGSKIDLGEKVHVYHTVWDAQRALDMDRMSEVYSPLECAQREQAAQELANGEYVQVGNTVLVPGRNQYAVTHLDMGYPETGLCIEFEKGYILELDLNRGGKVTQVYLSNHPGQSSHKPIAGRKREGCSDAAPLTFREAVSDEYMGVVKAIMTRSEIIAHPIK